MTNQNKNTTTLSVWCIALICLALTGAIGAQEIRTQLQVVSFKSLGADNLFFWKTEDTQSPDQQPSVKASASTLLPPVVYKGPPILTLMRPQADGKYQAMASTRLPSSSKRTIVILMPSMKKNGLPYQAMALDADLDNFKAGSRLLVNLSQIPVRGELGSKPFVRSGKNNFRFICKPRGMASIPVLDPNARALASQPLVLEYLSPKTEQWNTLTSTRWFHTPTQRHLIFVYHDPKRKNLILRGVTETLSVDDRDIAGNKASTDEDPETRAKRLEKTNDPSPIRPHGR